MLMCYQTQDGTLNAKTDRLINIPLQQVIEEYTKECTPARIATIVDENETIPKPTNDPNTPDHPYSQFKGMPYSTYTGGRESKFGVDMKDFVWNKRNRVVQLVCGPMLQHMMSAVRVTLSESISDYIDSQEKELTQYFRDCEETLSSKSSSGSGSSDDAQNHQAQAKAQAQQKIWATLQQLIHREFKQLKKAAQQHSKAYVKDWLKPNITKRILDDLRDMRDQALPIKKSRTKGLTVNAVRVEVFKAGVKAVADCVLKEMVHHIKAYSSLHVQAKLVKAISAVLRGYNGWLSQQHKTMTTTLDANYNEACKQLQQCIALDTVQSRSRFEYATVADTPLLIDKLKAVYTGDDAEFLNSVLDEIDNSAANDGDGDDDNDVLTTTAASGGSSSNSNNNGNSSSSRLTQLKRKHSAVGSNNTDNNNGDSDDDMIIEEVDSDDADE
jgi:hypothetical protein